MGPRCVEKGVTRSVNAIIDSLLPMRKRELEEVCSDIDVLVNYPVFRDRLLELNLVTPVDRPCLGYAPSIDPSLGIGKRYAWQLLVYREIVEELVSS